MDHPFSRPPVDDHVVADQSAVFTFLADPTNHGLPAGAVVERIDTHGAVIILAGDFAYKVKRAVLFDFMDFSTLDKRRAACAAECAINGTNAPGLYLGVVPITRTDGRLMLGGDGTVEEYAVRMRRFDPEDTLDRVAGRMPLSADLVAALARAVAQAHGRAGPDRTRDVVRNLASYIADNRLEFLRHSELFAADAVEGLDRACETALTTIVPLLRARRAAGFVRRCHGDLHLANIVLLDGTPVLFDAIEFNDDIAVCDVLYDLSFLLMDLWQQELPDIASGVFNRYFWTQPDDAALDGLAALPLFLSLRAAIRAKVETVNLAHLHGARHAAAVRRVRRMFQVARAFLGLEPDILVRPATLPPGFAGSKPKICAIGGLSGSGKTTRALQWAPFIGRPPGALVLRSDIERKRLFGVGETERLPEAAYAPEVTQQVYARLCMLARRVVGTGQSVIVDAVHARPDERTAIEAVARQTGVPFSGVWLDTPLDVRVARVEQRQAAGRDASDADGAVARRQQADDIDESQWQRITNT